MAAYQAHALLKRVMILIPLAQLLVRCPSIIIVTECCIKVMVQHIFLH